MTTLYREIDALGGAPMSSSDYGRAWSAGYDKALDLVLAILAKRGFSEFGDPVEALCDASEAILADLGPAGADGWTEGYAHVTDIDRLTRAIAVARDLPTPAVEVVL